MAEREASKSTDISDFKRDVAIQPTATGSRSATFRPASEANPYPAASGTQTFLSNYAF
jgi:hypothetical protein